MIVEARPLDATKTMCVPCAQRRRAWTVAGSSSIGVVPGQRSYFFISDVGSFVVVSFGRFRMHNTQAFTGTYRKHFVRSRVSSV